MTSPQRPLRAILALLVISGAVTTSAPATATPGDGQPSAATHEKALPPTPRSGPVTVDPRVRAEAEARGEATFWVYLTETADLSAAAAISDWGEQGRMVHDRLTRTAARTQRSIIRELTRRGARVESFWIANALRVTGDAGTLALLEHRPEVAAIAPDFVVRLHDTTAAPTAGVSGVEWNITRVRAPEAWSQFTTGTGIVVANIDTGVRHTHQALAGQYRGNQGGGSPAHDHNWFDAAGGCGAPCDDHGHGTHTMGTMVGDEGGANQIGVAPGARWIAARACTASGDCPGAHLLAAAQWIMAPTTLAGTSPQPGLRPHVVNNSWGANPNADPWFAQTVQAWVSAGIFPVFSAGNKGPGCQTAENPGNLPEAYAVGAFDSSNAIAQFSGRGMSAFGGVKPNITAPGQDIRSAGHASDTAYDLRHGTSMAAPHVAGTVALLWSAFPDYRRNVAATRSLLDHSAVPVAALECGGTAALNNVWGRGRLDAKAALDLALASLDTTTVGLVDPTQGRWHVRNSVGQVTSFFFGNPGDVPFMGDWNCNGIRTPGLYRQSDGFVYLRNSNTQGLANITFFFGNPGDVPIVGDFNGNGCETVSIYRPSNQTFYIVNSLGKDGAGLGAAQTSYVFGNPGDKPFTGDFDGDGVATIGLHRESTGLIYYRNSHTQGVAHNQFFFGDPGDRIVTGDWNGDGIDTPAVFRPSTATFYFRHTNTQGNADHQLTWGEPGWLPVSGRFALG